MQYVSHPTLTLCPRSLAISAFIETISNSYNGLRSSGTQTLADRAMTLLDDDEVHLPTRQLRSRLSAAVHPGPHLAPAWGREEPGREEELQLAGLVQGVRKIVKLS